MGRSYSSQPTAMFWSIPGGRILGDHELELVCPACQEDGAAAHVHPVDQVTYSGAPGATRFDLSFDAECGHYWVVRFRQHAGRIGVVTEVITDGAYPEIPNHTSISTIGMDHHR